MFVIRNILGVKLLIFALLLILTRQAYCQSQNIIGRVIADETGDVLEDVNISLYKGSHIIYSTTSDLNGGFIIPQSLYRSADVITIGGLNSHGLKLTNLPQFANGHAKDYNLGTFNLKSYSIQLKDVIIKSQKRYRDTAFVNLNLEKFERNYTVDDLLSQGDLFYKDTNGQFFYKGKLISEVVVDGKKFFGKNNSEIYNLLPALIVNDIQIIETNIDSVTNITTIRPSVKINLRLKEKYKNGKFGNSSFGFGTSERHILATNFYAYKNTGQLALAVNGNNINLGESPSQDPVITFAASGNNLNTKSSKISYNNTIVKKIELNISAKGKVEDRNVISKADRIEQVINQSSRTVNDSKSKTYDLSDARASLKLYIDSLNTLDIIYTTKYNKVLTGDSLVYSVTSASHTTSSTLSKDRIVSNSSSSTDIIYFRKFSHRPGRNLNIIMNRGSKSVQNNEFNNALTIDKASLKAYFIQSSKKLIDDMYSISTSFTEPLNDNTSLALFMSYKNEISDYGNIVKSDTVFTLGDRPTEIKNEYYNFGLRLQKTLKDISLNCKLWTSSNFRGNIAEENHTRYSFYNLNMDFDVGYKIDNKKMVLASYIMNTNYPELTQLTSISNTFDLISQSNGNLELRPEKDHNLKVSYNSRKSSSESLSLNADLHFYKAKYGMNIIALSNQFQNTFIDNVGNPMSASVGISIQQHIANKFYFNYVNNLIYQQQPTLVNGELIENNGFLVNQSIATNLNVFKGKLSLTPILSGTYGKYDYSNLGSSDFYSLTYSDKISLNIARFNFDLYPLATYNYNVNINTSFSMNAAIKRSMFKKSVIAWLTVYDVFNSFKFNNNVIGSSYKEVRTYSNVSRYITFGVNVKFNNLK